MPVATGDVLFVCEESDRPEIEVRIVGEGDDMIAVPTGRQQACTVDKSSSCTCPAECDCYGPACPCQIKWNPDGESPRLQCDANDEDACSCREQCGYPKGCQQLPFILT